MSSGGRCVMYHGSSLIAAVKLGKKIREPAQNDRGIVCVILTSQVQSERKMLHEPLTVFLVI